MRNTWTRAWLATLVLLVASGVLVSNRHDLLIEVEEPVMDWLLEDTDVSGWARVDLLGRLALVIPGTLLMAGIALRYSRPVAGTVLLTMLFGVVLGRVTKAMVGRPRPTVIDGVESSSFPSSHIVQAGIFWGLVALLVWWFGAPRLVWQIVVEICVVIVLLTSIGRIVRGYSWPTDAVGSALVVTLALISAAIIIEDHPPRLRRFRPRSSESAPIP